MLAKLEALMISDYEDPPSGNPPPNPLPRIYADSLLADNWQNSDGDMPSDSESDHFGASP